MLEQKTVREMEKLLQTEASRGLTEGEAALRLARDGKNELKKEEKKKTLELFWEQIDDPLICVLLAAAFLSFLLKEISDTMIILFVVLANAAVGIIQEGKAIHALEALKKLTSPTAIVKRGGRARQIPASQLVKGDVVLLEAGMQIPADLRLTRTFHMAVEESALTGESCSVEKDALFLAEKELPVGDRKNQAFMSTLVTAGRGEGMVMAVGMGTEIGKIASVLDSVDSQPTPLQKRLGDLGRVLSIVSVLLCLALFVVGVFQRRNLAVMFLTAVSLAVAAVPEGLPAIVTLVFAMSVQRMAKENTVIRKLPSVETLGAVNVICSDKTGTLTQNKMAVAVCYAGQKLVDARQAKYIASQELLECMVLCNDAALGKEGEESLGDSTELALLRFAGSMGVGQAETVRRLPRIREKAFDSNRKMMTTVHRGWQHCVSYTKGAPEAVLGRCSQIALEGGVGEMAAKDKRKIEEALASMSSRGLRTMAFAMKIDCRDTREEKLVFLGMTGMMDPVRPEAVKAVAQFKKASVRTVMITGDHRDTALSIARELGIAKKYGDCMTGEELDRISDARLREKIDSIRVFARVSPEHKMRIVKALKEKGNIVAMTGDGVNDAPSLKMADIGIAMGKNGTDAAKNAADMILTDDNFATIEKAMEEGRGIYENIKKTVIFLLSSNFGEIMTMFCAVVLGMASPLKASHILWINLITDSLPAFALGVDKNDREELMEEEPRKAGESLFANGGFSCTVFYGILIAGISLAAYLKVPVGILRSEGQRITLGGVRKMLESPKLLASAQTYAFTVLGMSQLFHAVGMRDVRASAFSRRQSLNPVMAAALFMGLFLQLLVTKVPYLTKAFGTATLSGKEWASLLLLAAFPLLAHELLAGIAWREGRKEVEKAEKEKKACQL